MALYYGSTRLRQKVVEDSGLSPEVVHKVLDAHDNAVRQLVDAGVWVWIADLGHLVKVVRAATRRKIPSTGALVDVPAKPRIVFKQPRLRTEKQRLNEQEPVRDS